MDIREAMLELVNSESVMIFIHGNRKDNYRYDERLFESTK